ncbi:MAG TPA: hypothetical protein VGC13_04930 [Longimicrobium sp.]|jgi:hypothetical protein|uniref:hypothetical protein n=1 Tax=Longimicrobium sp. TaxID=2029185 RepID=UPI002EDA6731
MRKLTLDLHALQVEAFEVEAPEGHSGTVAAAEQTANTCANTCEHPLAGATCWTCANTCPNTCRHTCASPQQPCQG